MVWRSTGPRRSPDWGSGDSFRISNTSVTVVKDLDRNYLRLLGQWGYELQPKLRMKFSAVVRTAARQTRDRASDSPRAREIEKTIRALVNKTPDAFMPREGKVVTTLFVANAEIMARRAPFRAVR